MSAEKMDQEFKINILAIEDEKNVRNLYATVLGEEDYKIVTAATGAEAIEKFGREKFDLVILDLKMPDIYGTEILKQIKEKDPEISVIIATGYPSLESSIDAIKTGVYDYIVKPFGPKELRVIVRRAWEKLKLINENKRLIEELREINKELEEVKEYLDNIIESMIETLMVVDPSNTIKMVNKATCDLLAYEKDELIDKPVSVIVTGEDSPFKEARLKTLIEEGSIRDYEIIYQTKSGEKIPVSFSGAALRDRAGNLIGIVGIARDMREIKRFMEKEKELAAIAAVAAAEKKRADKLAKAYQELTEMQTRLIQNEKLAAVGTLGGGAAHELNNPLTGIAGLVSYVRDELGESDKKREILQIVVQETKRCSKIVTDLLTFSQPKTEKFSLASCNEIIDTALAIAAKQLKEGNIKVIKKYAKDLPKIKLDLFQLQQAFINLIANAREAMENSANKELRIETRSLKDSIEIEFCDKGRGILKKNLPNIFDPFFTTKDIGKGTGLGLSVVRNIIEMHQGKIDITSEPGTGSRVVIKIPR